MSVSWSIGLHFLLWPSPQKHLALSVLFLSWGMLFVWVLFLGGAKTLSKYLPIISNNFPEFALKETSIKVGAVLLIASGVTALLLPRV